VSGFNVDDMVIDLFYWFEKSINRKAGLVEYCTFCDFGTCLAVCFLPLKCVESSSSFHLCAPTRYCGWVKYQVIEYSLPGESGSSPQK
jgi:hypothetical protein